MPNFSTDIDDVRGYAKDLLGRQQGRMEKHIRVERINRLEKWVLEEVNRAAPQHKDNWPTVTTNEPRTLFNAIRRACGKNDVRHQIELPQLPTDEEHDEINRHERLLIGCWNDTDLLRRRRGMGRFQQDGLWFAALRGGVFVRPLVLKSAPFTPFRVELWDAVATVYEPGSTGLAFVAHFRMVPKNSLLEDYGTEEDEDKNGNVSIADIWWKGKWGDAEGVWNVILGPKVTLKGPDAKKEWGPEPFDEIPVFCIKGGSPGEQKPEGDSIGDQRLEDAWETIFDANETAYAWFNRIASLYGLIVRNGAIGPYQVDEAVYRRYGDQIAKNLKPFGIVPGNIAGVGSPPMAQEAKELFSYLQGALQRGGVPYSSFGQVPFEMSGFGINQLQGGIEVSALPVTQTIEDMYWVADDEILRQVRKLKGKFRVQGLDNAGKAFLEEIAGAKLDKNYIVNTKLQIALPQDELLRAQVAETLQRLGVSQLTVFDKYLDIQDPHGEYERRLAEEADREPVVKTLKMAAVAMQQGHPEIAAYLLQTYAMPALQAGNAAKGANPPPEAQPPESRGQLEQHNEFQAPPQNIPIEVRAGVAGQVLG
jgi:hypothetical protein